MTDLLDLNVWLALADGNHPHHPAVARYWKEHGDTAKAFCRVTMLGFLRLTSKAGVLSSTLTPAAAWAAYQSLLATPTIVFLPEPAGLGGALADFAHQPGFAPSLWTDACLAAFALAGGHRLVTFDRDYGRFGGLKMLRLGA